MTSYVLKGCLTWAQDRPYLIDAVPGLKIDVSKGTTRKLKT